MDGPNSTTPPSPTSPKLVLASIAKIASAVNVSLPEGTIAVYLERLISLSPERLIQAVNRTIDDWRMAGLMPPIPFILDRSWIRPDGDEVVDDAPRIFSRDRLLAAAGEKIGHAEVEQWLAEAKQAQQEHMAKLEADPRWRAMAERRGAFPGLPGKPSRVHEDAEERAGWARDQAKKQGWR